MWTSCLGRFVRPMVLILGGVIAIGMLCAQGRIFGGGQIFVPPGTRTARELGTRSVGTPEWVNEPGFGGDVFTFARLRYDAAPRPATGRRT